MMRKVATTDDRYLAAHEKSATLYERAQQVFPSGITHDLRYIRPFPPYIDRAEGAHKWDVDGNRYVDFLVGHGALLLGHGHPKVIAAVSQQLTRGTHYGGSHELEVRWGELVKQLVPSAERVKFVSSGTEAVHLALRLARAVTGKTKLVKFQGHFHGWSDDVAIGNAPPFDVPVSKGVLVGDRGTTITLPINDPDAVEAQLATDRDIAAVILEPAGMSTGIVPVAPGFLAELREITRRHGVLLIFDEVVTGFRFSPGGVQAKVGVTPDLTTLAKIVAGGLPGGAVVGRQDILDRLAFRDDSTWNRFERISHPGTYNANPLSAAAGIAALTEVATGEPNRRADEIAAKLRAALSEVVADSGVPGRVYGEASAFHIHLGPEPQPGAIPSMPKTVQSAIQREMLLGGADLMYGVRGFTSMAHTEEDVATAATALRNAIQVVREEGLL